MKYAALLVSVVFLASGAHGFLGDLFKGWGVSVGKSVGLGGLGVDERLSLGDPQVQSNVKDYSGGTGAGVGGTISLGPFGSFDIGLGLGVPGGKVKEVPVTVDTPDVNSPAFRATISTFFDRFPIFKDLETAQSPSVISRIVNTIQSNPNILNEIMTYIGQLPYEAQRAIQYFLAQLFQGSPVVTVV